MQKFSKKSAFSLNKHRKWSKKGKNGPKNVCYTEFPFMKPAPKRVRGVPRPHGQKNLSWCMPDFALWLDITKPSRDSAGPLLSNSYFYGSQIFDESFWKSKTIWTGWKKNKGGVRSMLRKHRLSSPFGRMTKNWKNIKVKSFYASFAESSSQWFRGISIGSTWIYIRYS